jgi:prepilin peptidase CpaA
MFGDAFLSVKIIMACYAAPLLVAAAFDFWTYRIPNVVTGTFALLYFACVLYFFWGMGINWLSHFGACLAVLAVGLGLFYFNIFGGGDIKLLAAVALWIGFTRELVVFLLVAGVAGGVLALLLLALRNGLSLLPIPFPAYLPAALQARSPIPYGVAVVAGALWVISSIPFVLA